jgi:hypothetical protein
MLWPVGPYLTYLSLHLFPTRVLRADRQWGGNTADPDPHRQRHSSDGEERLRSIAVYQNDLRSPGIELASSEHSSKD